MEKISKSLSSLFMDKAAGWYKAFVLAILVLNPLLLMTCGPFWTGWAVLLEFLLILSFSLECYPLFPGGLLALQVLVLGMTPIGSVMKEIHANIDVIMLLMFMVPGIYFMKPLLAWIFMRLFAATRNKVVLSLVFLVAGAFLAAWLDALTVVAVMITVCVAAKELHARTGVETDAEREEFDGFLRNLLMHGAIGTGLGGVATLIGQPQNIIIGHYAGWSFQDFYVKMAHFSIPLQILGLAMCWALEHFRAKVFGFGYQLPERIGLAFEQQAREELAQETHEYKVKLIVMAVAFAGLMGALAFQIAPVGVIGLGLLICLPLLTGQTDEHKIGSAFSESMPFASLLVVFFVIVAMIETLGIFQPITAWALQGAGKAQLYSFFTASGVLSAVSDNVFVGTIYIHQAYNAFNQGLVDAVQFDRLCAVINAGTNIFSILTPSGQAAFLFLFTSAIGRKIGLSYVRMFVMALPYAVVLIAASYMMI